MSLLKGLSLEVYPCFAEILYSTWTGYGWKVRSNLSSIESNNNGWKGMNINFLSCDIWKTLCNLDMEDGKVSCYTTMPTLLITWKGLMHIRVKFLVLNISQNPSNLQEYMLSYFKLKWSSSPIFIILLWDLDHFHIFLNQFYLISILDYFGSLTFFAYLRLAQRCHTLLTIWCLVWYHYNTSIVTIVVCKLNQR